ncbi:amidohydrolase family protein [Roseovarius salinarum]|uniref:hypothetical protein n=1 Tax=Roseovarius salinarum TaxID=1981892 RepID=UPI000C340F0F|nr:hypothetical protein [Roseovarius salinarum]
MPITNARPMGGGPADIRNADGRITEIGPGLEHRGEPVKAAGAALALPGLVTRPGTAALMDAALRAGAGLVGGIGPRAIDRDPRGHLECIIGLAETHGMHGRVTVSHAFCLGMSDQMRVEGLLERLARNDVRIMTKAPPPAPFRR